MCSKLLGRAPHLMVRGEGVSNHLQMLLGRAAQQPSAKAKFMFKASANRFRSSEAMSLALKFVIFDANALFF